MENGSFHTSPQSVLETDDLVKNVPLPFEMPKGMEFTRAPGERTGSSTLETVIGQNEDLMARLGVALRRSSQLEEKMAHFEKENVMLRHRLDSIKDALLVLQQKDQMSAQRSTTLLDENSELKAQIKKLEGRYTDLFVHAKDMREHVVRLERYRLRIRQAASTVQARAKQAAQLNASNIELATKNTTLVRSYEEQLNALKTELEFMAKHVADRDQVFEEKIEFENRAIFLERQNENQEAELNALRTQARVHMHDLNKATETEASLRDQLRHQITQREEFQAQVTILTKEMSAIRTQARSQMEELNRLTESEAKLREEVETLRLSEHNLTEQVNTLQVLWQEKQLSLDKLEEKNSSLQRLNQQLSLNLNQARKEIHILQNEKEFERQQAEEQIKSLREEIRLLQEKR